ncbi:hypothetical protein HZA55_05860 [Candidatus Poribacteria bacterium]|nr:hypothetical protein [Candidatus Poribacteria bacterium]
MQIISKIYEKGVIKLVVFDFVEANSGKRLKLSNIIESELRTIFGKAEDIVIIDSDNSQLQEPSGIERIKIAATLDMFAFTKIDSSENILAELNSFTLKNWVEDNAEIRIFEN